MKAEVFSSLKDVDKDFWNSIIKPDHIICSYEHLRAVEESGINDCDYRYIMITENKRLLAHTCIYSISFNLDILNKGIWARIYDSIRKNIYSQFLRIRVVECGCPTALGSTITISDNVDREGILRVIIQKMEEFAREKKIKILLLRDFYDKDLFFFDKLTKQGFKRINNMPNIIIKNKWSTFNDYLNDLRSHYRYKIKKTIKVWENKSLKIEIRDNFSDIAEILRELWYQVFDNAKEYQREIITTEYFINMDKYLGNKSKIVLFKKGEEIIGFLFCVLDDFTLRPIYIGMDYKYNFQYKLYFNILCQEIIYGIELKKKMIEMGITTIFPKKNLGAQVFPLYGYMKHLSFLKNIVITNLFNLFSPTPEIDIKHVYNRRYFDRIYKTSKIDVLYNNIIANATVNNINEFGVQITIKTKMKKGREILIRMKICDETTPVLIKGNIVWVKKSKGKYNAGVQFIDINDETFERIKKLLHNLEYG